jgi:transposase-like protein
LDTSEVVAKGRAGQPNYPIKFKRRLVVESCEPEISVAKLAQRHGLNAKMLFQWRREYRAGKLDSPHKHHQSSAKRSGLGHRLRVCPQAQHQGVEGRLVAQAATQVFMHSDPSVQLVGEVFRQHT